MKLVQTLSGARLAAIAELACIIGRVTKIDRDSKRAERTDLDAVWEALYAIRKDARLALRELTAAQDATPELLAALTAAADEIARLHYLSVPRLEGKIGEPDKAVEAQARAAIAKAKGAQ